MDWGGIALHSSHSWNVSQLLSHLVISHWTLKFLQCLRKNALQWFAWAALLISLMKQPGEMAILIFSECLWKALFLFSSIFPRFWTEVLVLWSLTPELCTANLPEGDICCGSDIGAWSYFWWSSWSAEHSVYANFPLPRRGQTISDTVKMLEQ